MSVVSVVFCRVEVSALADQSSRGVLPSAMCVCVCVCVCDRQATTVRPWPTRSCCAISKYVYYMPIPVVARSTAWRLYGANSWLYVDTIRALLRKDDE